MVPDRLLLVEAATALNSKLVSLPRLEIMGFLVDAAPDGIEYRELKAGLGMSDGKLVTNLKSLADMGYLVAKRAKVERKKLTVYFLTPDGLAAWHQTRRWLQSWLANDNDNRTSSESAGLLQATERQARHRRV